MGWEEWIGLVLLAAASFGIGGLMTSQLERRHASTEAETERAHASAEARAARRFQIRFEAYKAASHYLSRHQAWVQFTEPVWGPLPEPPDISPNEEWIEFGGVIAISASDEVRDALRAVGDAEDAFAVAVQEYRRWMAGQKVESENAGIDMNDKRKAAIAAIEKAQTLMRDELSDL